MDRFFVWSRYHAYNSTIHIFLWNNFLNNITKMTCQTIRWEKREKENSKDAYSWSWWGHWYSWSKGYAISSDQIARHRTTLASTSGNEVSLQKVARRHLCSWAGIVDQTENIELGRAMLFHMRDQDTSRSLLGYLANIRATCLLYKRLVRISPFFSKYQGFVSPKSETLRYMTFLRAEKYPTNKCMFWSSYTSGIGSFLLLFRRLSIKGVAVQYHAASLTVSTHHSTTRPVYVVQLLQNSEIRFSWVWEFATSVTIKSSILLLDLLSILLLFSGTLQNPR